MANDGMFERPVIVLRVFWLRDQMCPYTPEDAIAEGLVVESGDVEDFGNPSAAVLDDPAAGGAGEDQGDVSGDVRPDGAGPAGDLSGEDAGGMAVAGALDGFGDSAGEGQGAVASGLQAAAPSYLLADTLEPVAPGDDFWPAYPCIRQLTQIDQVIVDDRECEFADIPILHNVNRPIPLSPFGMGEPFMIPSTP